ncbi:helix-turn-helix domain-containing protein [Paenibacillus vulneris]|uniref:Winged helix-turn-helix transcriptional regulator n=1 Tax=Paenibacillus vulneris TaxID=1133364 RepID=A0ABW3UE25_9BACL|nr:MULTISPECIES: winged helix-turn-helix transcriptional regulator [unclassified Paenibacillus]MBE1441245.1 DNA-binding HxlR family transcriptional regulator [Paenibacillus sp. OAS669]
MRPTDSDYAANVTLGILEGKWKLLLICHLRNGTKRFSEFTQLIPGLTQKVLTYQLRELESHGLVKREIYPEIPPKVEYSLTPYGESLIPLLDLMNQWGKEHLARSRQIC